MNGIGYLITAVTKLRQKGFVQEANRLEKVIDNLKELKIEEGEIEDILSSYSRIHSLATIRQKVITAVIRKENECPFGLPIPQACKYAGDSVNDMAEGPHKINRMIYNSERDHSRCIFNDGLMEKQKSVNCTYGSILQGQKSIKMFHGNPQYPKMWSGFSGIALDRGYHAYSQQYGNELFPYPSIYG